MSAATEPDLAALERRLVVLHDRIRRRALAALGGSADADPAAAAAAVARREAAGDVSFALDLPAEEEIERFAAALARELPLVVVAEGLGERRYGRGEPRLRLIADPVDGTRNLAFGLRPGWILTAVAAERGADTSLADVRLAVQSEIPLPAARSARLLIARRGAGARLSLRPVAGPDDGTPGGAVGVGAPPVALTAPTEPSLDNGYYVFFKFWPGERVDLARIEARFLELLVDATGADPRTLYDDQYISNAGQLFLLATGRYRMVADLRAWLAARRARPTFASRPYDLCCALVAEEAGCELTTPAGAPLDPPLDLATEVSFVGWSSAATRRRLEPLLARALEEVPVGGGGDGTG